jgi:IS5 family transposase
VLARKQYRDLTVIGELVRQQRDLYMRKSWSIAGRIVSIGKPHVRPIARWKARGMYEFGVKLSVSLVDGMAEVHRLSWEPYNECQDLKGQLERYKEWCARIRSTGHERICGTARSMEYDSRGRNWGGHSRTAARTKEGYEHKKESNDKMRVRGSRERGSLGKGSGGIRLIGSGVNCEQRVRAPFTWYSW